jgi:hypothetical protein
MEQLSHSVSLLLSLSAAGAFVLKVLMMKTADGQVHMSSTWYKMTQNETEAGNYSLLQ